MKRQTSVYRKPVSGTDFREIRLHARLSIDEAAELVGVTPRTVHNWEHGVCGAPYSAFKLLRLQTGCELAGEAWRGFRLYRDTLISPEGKSFKPVDLAWLALTFRKARAFHQLYEAQGASNRAALSVGAMLPALAPAPAGVPLPAVAAPADATGGRRGLSRRLGLFLQNPLTRLYEAAAWRFGSLGAAGTLRVDRANDKAAI